MKKITKKGRIAISMAILPVAVIASMTLTRTVEGTLMAMMAVVLLDGRFLYGHW